MHYGKTKFISDMNVPDTENFNSTLKTLKYIDCIYLTIGQPHIQHSSLLQHRVSGKNNFIISIKHNIVFQQKHKFSLSHQTLG